MDNRKIIKAAKKTKVHFMGIGGSAMSGVSLLAHELGYEVTGCDLESDTPYLKKLKSLKIPIFVGHDARHLEGVKILASTPAAFFLNPDHPELKTAQKEGKLMTWQEFLGKYLQAGKKVICISGTHGKSTTTGMSSLIFEKAGLDPSVVIGATVKDWGSNYRAGKRQFFITEADEFYDSFLNYSPETIVLNNIEFDHPDYFKDEAQLIESFKRHVSLLKGDRNLIFNQDSPGIKKLFNSLGESSLNELNLYGYTISSSPIIDTPRSLKAINIKLSQDSSQFRVRSDALGIEEAYRLKIPGLYNISNSLGVILLASLYKISTDLVKSTLSNFDGVGRRMELVGNKRGVVVYDDYAHHPTAIKVTLEGFRQKHPKNRIWAIIEPHTFSRTKALLSLYKNAFDKADNVVVAPIFRSRDSEDYGVSGQSIVDTVGSKKVLYLDSFDKIVQLIKSEAVGGDRIIVMGAGKSSELARSIFKAL